MTFVSQHEIDQLAGRIERAYERRGGHWNASCSTSRVWTAVARILVQCRLDDPATPVDPELYVASQDIDPDSTDPWTDLASPRAVERYRRQVRAIIRQLRSELEREVRKAERSIRRGRPTAEVLGDRGAGLSPLGRYIAAHRAGRVDLAERWSPEALIQHRGCPLYREACAGLLPADEYPREPAVLKAPRPYSFAYAGSPN